MNPQLDRLVTSNDVLNFTLSGVDVSIANAIRRIMISDIPSVIFRTTPYEKNKANFIENTSRLNNEIIKQRLSCIPIHITDMDFPLDQYEVEIKKENSTYAPILVTTEDFKVKNMSNGSYLTEQEVKKIFPPDPITKEYISLVRLQPQIMEKIPGEAIHIVCKLDIGTGGEDGSFSAVCTSAYSYTQDVDAASKKWNEKEAMLKANQESDDIIEKERLDWLALDSKRITIDNSYDFIVESVGVFENTALVKSACEIAIKKISNIENMMQDGKVEIAVSETTIENCFDIKLENEDYTIGKVLEYILYEKFYTSDVLTFCNFKKFHPHLTYGTLRLAFSQSTDVENITQYILIACASSKEIFDKINTLF